MATFTVYVKEISGEDADPDFTKLGLNDYPIYSEEYRAVLNQKIFDQFMNREIGQESVSMWRLAMRRHMNNIMPYYNEQYKLSLLDIDPLSTVSMESITDSVGNTEATGESNNVSTVDSKSKALSSQYPQTFITEEGNYAMEGQGTEATTGTTGDATEKQLSKQDAKVSNSVKGYQGHAPALIYAARQALINIDMLILDDIEKAGLFMMVWGSTDEFTEGPRYVY